MTKRKLEEVSERLTCTVVIASVYCMIWRVLEKLIHGEIQINLVDDLMMVLCLPIIWLAPKPIYIKFVNKEYRKE